MDEILVVDTSRMSIKGLLEKHIMPYAVPQQKDLRRIKNSTLLDKAEEHFDSHVCFGSALMGAVANAK